MSIRGIEERLEWPYREGLIASARLQTERNSDAFSDWKTYFGKWRTRKLISGNHRFYLGKSYDEDEDDGTRRWRGPAIYGEDNIKGILAILFDHLEPEQQAQLVICPEFSTWFNGSEDGQTPMTPEQQKAWIYSLARRHFKKGEESLNVVSIGDDPRHSALTQAIRAKVDSGTGLCDVKKALRTEDTVELDPSSSLGIARFLFSVAQKSRAFRGAMYETLPSSMKGTRWNRQPFDELEDDEKLQKIAYPLTELSVRLSDLLSGCSFQGGVERQARYDEVIQAIFGAGKDPAEGALRKVTTLQPLAKHLQDKSFTGVYLNQEENYFPKKKQQIQARVRLGVYGLLCAAGLGGAAWIGGYDQRVIDERRAEYLDQCLAEKMPNVLSDERIARFREFEKVAEEELVHRYSVSYHNKDVWSGGFTDYYCNQTWLPDFTNRRTTQDFVDDFVDTNPFSVTTAGGVARAPYSYLDQDKDTLRDFLQVNTSTREELYGESYHSSMRALYDIIDMDGTHRHLVQYLYGQGGLYALYERPIERRSDALQNSLGQPEPQIWYSAVKAQEAIRALVATRERFEARKVTSFFDGTWDFDTTSIFPPLGTRCGKEDACKDVTPYPGYLGPDYTLAHYYDPERQQWIPVVKEGGEDLYTYSNALEAWGRYADALNIDRSSHP